MGTFSNIKDAILNRLKIKPAASQAEEVKDKAKDKEELSQLELDAIHKKLEDVFNIAGDEKGLIENIQTHINIYANLYDRLGQWHGKIGARDFNIIKTTTAHATLVTDRVSSNLEGRIEGLAFDTTRQNSTLDELKENHKHRQEELQEFIALQINDNKHFNRINALVYCLAGVLMVLADIAVSINLVAFLGIGHPKLISTFWDKISDVELLFFSLGIAFCTVFVKILYDDYINSKLGYSQLEVNKLVDKGIPRKSLSKELIIKLSVKLIILIGLLFLLYYLAKYRTYFTVYGSIKGQINDIQKSGVIPDLVEVILKSFIGITVIIPIISGIALSSGLKIFSNRRALKEAKKNEKSAEEKYQQCKKDLEGKTNTYKQLIKYGEDWQNKPKKIELISEFFVQKYEQGFRIGYRQEFGNDIYIIIEEYRNEIINKTFSNRINKINEHKTV